MKDSSILELELKKLGLTTKESRIYLVALEKGHSSVQDIAKEVKLSRPTTYRIIESLEKKGLLLGYKKKEGKLISAQSPDELLGILRVNKRRIEEQEREFLRIISLLKAQYSEPYKNEIKAYSGELGQRYILDDFSTTHSTSIFFLFHSNSDPLLPLLEETYDKIRKRLGNSCSLKEMFPTHIDSLHQEFVERKFVPHLDSFFPGTIIITEKVIYAIENEFFVIEQENIVQLLRSIAESFWNTK